MIHDFKMSKIVSLRFSRRPWSRWFCSCPPLTGFGAVRKGTGRAYRRRPKRGATGSPGATVGRSPSDSTHIRANSLDEPT